MCGERNPLCINQFKNNFMFKSFNSGLSQLTVGQYKQFRERFLKEMNIGAGMFYQYKTGQVSLSPMKEKFINELFASFGVTGKVWDDEK